MAWLIRNSDKITWPSADNGYLTPCAQNKFHPDLRFFPRCHGRIALNDAVVALSCPPLIVDQPPLAV